MSSEQLHGASAALFDWFQSYGFDRDVDIANLYAQWRAFFAEGEDAPEMTTREMQQRIGSVISRVNRMIAEDGMKIIPGELKRTYRLTRM